MSEKDENEFQFFLDELTDTLRANQEGCKQIESITSDIVDHYEQICKKLMDLSNVLEKMTQYWDGSEKFLKKSFPQSGDLSNQLKNLRTSLMSYSLSMAKPMDLFKTSLQASVRQSRKEFEGVGEVDF